MQRLLSFGLWMFVLMAWSIVSTRAGIGEWKTYTNKREVRALAQDHGTIWAATSGGMFLCKQSDGTFQEFTTSEGLRTIDLTAITVDREGTIWVGSTNGFLHAYHPTHRTWEYVADLSLSDAAQKTINKLDVIGDTLFIMSDIGVSIFSLSKREFGDTYMRFGVSPTQMVGNVTSLKIFNGKIWVGTRNGIASTPLTNPNPTAPDSWQVYTTGQGLPSNSVKQIEIAFDSLFAATSSGVAIYDGASWNTVQGTGGLNVIDVSSNVQPCTDCSNLFFVTLREMWRYENGQAQVVASGFPSNVTALLGDRTVGTMSGVILFDNSFVGRTIFPPGPPSNSFVGLAVDERGVVWSGTGVLSSDGAVRFDGQTWRTYNPLTDTILGSGGGAAYQVDLGPANSKWVSFFGGGVAVIDDDDSIRRVFNATKGLSYTENSSNNRNFCVVTGVATDRSSDVWVNVRSANDRRLLAISSLSADTLRYILYPGTDRPPILTNIIMDSYGTFWFTSASDVANQSPGLVFYDPTLSLSGRLTPTSGWGVVAKENGLTSNQVSACAVDNDGNLWVGAPDAGISIIIDPTNARNRILIYHPLRDQKINDILVDPLNQKWVATDNGVFLLSSDGTSIIDRYTVASTAGKIPDDKVTSLAMNRSTGTMYFGTEKGLASLTTSALTPLRSFEGLKLFPNPLYLPSSSLLTVDGLVQNSALKILSVDGNLVREIRTPGGRVGFWDGKDERGEFVASGVYIVVAFSEDGSKVAKGKIAVVRK